MSKKAKSKNATEKITRDDLRQALSELQGDLDEAGVLAKLGYGVGAAALAMAGLAYLVGRRAGRLRSTIVEVRRL